uniref:Large ribosomal subunit protein uL18c n=1 Tax=Caulacanthus okamurae TaxID=152008 RepID=A0A6H1UAE7_9FLOR|nr:50S ribosomal protein L18 [Caulacanthus okamurae]QIZ74649.1 50S ribosomal protein L18 [Caulacanthus okamurae]
MTKTLKEKNKRPRLYIFRSNKHIYAQIIDDFSNRILLSSSSIAKNLKLKIKINHKSNCKVSEIVGKDIAQKAISIGLKTVVFDRGKKLYHGRIRALANAVRKEGIEF